MRNELRLLLAFALAAPLSAQTVHTRAASAARPVVAGIAPPATLIVVSGDERFVTMPLTNTTVVFANIPAFVFSDGRVFANFGRGLEQVVRPCGSLLNTSGELFATSGQPTVVQPTVIQPAPGASQPLPFTPNVPNQPTASQQMLAQAIASGPVIVNSGSCFAANRVGQVFVTRP